MSYSIIPTKFFLEQLDELSFEAKSILEKRFNLIKEIHLETKELKDTNSFFSE